MQLSPKKVEVIGAFLAIQWEDNQESIIDAKTLRQNSPSAENQGETDLFGNLPKIKQAINPEDVRIIKFEKIGNYAIRLIFSDGHSTGIYNWSLLQDLSKQVKVE